MDDTALHYSNIKITDTTKMAGAPQNESAPLNPFKDPGGKQSKIHDYCTEPKRQAKSCVWFCRRYGRDVLAFDVNVEDIEDGAKSLKLQRFDDWWRRFGFYNIVGVRHVKVSPFSTSGPMLHVADPEPSHRRSSFHSQS
jgi:hypothetical protein